MQRPTYGPAQSPPLHHPVPQHVSTVPQLRSPPPPMPAMQSHDSYGYPQQGAPHQQQQQQQPGGGAAGGWGHPAFGGFISDPTAQMGFQVGKSAVMAGQEYMEQNLNRYVNFSALKHYFNVSNSYVANKLFLVLFPWRHRPWSRKQAVAHAGGGGGGGGGQVEGFYLPPREDINSPDMYIPVMSVVTYILLSTLLAGLRGNFNPEILGRIATHAVAVVFLELVGLKLGTYLLSITNDSQLLDLIAYSGYKFVGVIATIVCAELVNAGRGTGGWIGWSIFLYCFAANAFFLLRSLKYVLLPDTNSVNPAASAASYTIARSQRNRRTQFLFFYAYVVQFLFMWWLSRAANTA